MPRSWDSLQGRSDRQGEKLRSSEVPGLFKCAFKEHAAKQCKQMFFSSNSKVNTKVKDRWTTALETQVGNKLTSLPGG